MTSTGAGIRAVTLVLESTLIVGVSIIIANYWIIGAMKFDVSVQSVH